ncbi:MAG: SusC/RagA family TonB-linked outer membrane protein [Bacteroidales bacterium]|nr:SusC/RagA family TonB-linked outer membrane protein [Bacteroidales bacterium]
MKRILTAIAVLLMACATVFAQGGYQVKGVVVDDMGPVIGAAVVQQGTTNGTSTGIDGDFVLTVPNADAMIEISCIGYATQVFKASEVPSTITLAEDSHFLDEVVVIGYGTVKKSDLTGSVSTVKADEINKGVITSPTDLLRGKSAGVVVTAGNGMPGSAPTVRIRGGSSINASNTPLYVIDGLPVSNDGIAGMADPMASINPEDIESFSVLKDASATAIYGSRASNGVIVITTKKGSKSSSKMPRVAADFTTSVNTIAKYNNVLDGDGILNLIRDFYGVNSAAEQHLGVAGKLYNTDWQKEIYRIATTIDANMSLTGKLGFLPYRISTGVLQQKGTLKGSEMDRLALGLNLSPSFFDNHLTVNVNGKGTYALNWYADQGAIGSANHYDPTKPVYNDVPGYSLNGFTAWYDQSGNINGMATQNPVAQLKSRYDTADTYRFIGNAQFDYKIHGFEDLRLNLNLGIDWATSSGVTDVARGSEASWHNTNQSGGGSHTDYGYKRMDTTLEFYADYNHTFAEKHNVDLMAGYSWQRFYSENNSKSVRMSDGASLGQSVGKGELYLISFFGRANYAFADRYLLTATLRADGTSRFQNHKWGIFPSVALGWNILKEPFMANVDKLSTLKLRLSWGETGQQEVGGYYDTFAQFLTTQQGSYYFVNGDAYTNPIVALGYSADLRWETTTTYNAGIDFGFWDNRITTSVDVYKRDTRDILNYIPVPALSNLTNYLNTNIGSMTNQGAELDINAVLAESRDLSWTAGFNVAYNQNTVTKLTVSDENATGVETGGISGGTGNNVQMIQVGYPIRTFNLYQQVYDKEGNPINGVYVDRNDDGQINADDKYLGHHADADFTFGFNTNLSWKNWTAALSGHASLGNWVYNNVASDTEMLADLWTNQFVSNRVASAPKSMFSQAQYLSDYYLQDGSFLKLDNFTLGYTIPSLFYVTADRPFSLNIFGTVQNICTFTRYTGIDPEIFGGIDGTVYPRPRTFILGAKVNF